MLRGDDQTAIYGQSQTENRLKNAHILLCMLRFLSVIPSAARDLLLSIEEIPRRAAGTPRDMPWLVTDRFGDTSIGTDSFLFLVLQNISWLTR